MPRAGIEPGSPAPQRDALPTELPTSRAHMPPHTHNATAGPGIEPGSHAPQAAALPTEPRTLVLSVAAADMAFAQRFMSPSLSAWNRYERCPYLTALNTCFRLLTSGAFVMV